MIQREEQKKMTRQRIVDAAGRGFRRGGYGGIGVDGLAKEAGMTSGAFYVHFDSKKSAFRESMLRGLVELQEGVNYLQAEHGADWWPEFVRYYLSAKRTCDLSESCALQSLPPEVARLDASLRTEFEAALRKIAKSIAAGPPSPITPADEESAYAALALLTGAVTLARAVSSESLAKKIAQGALRTLLPVATSAVKKSPVKKAPVKKKK
ncbi:TetR/AcrR family transcriptional regulator [Dyella sp. M7H15-1]|uniref:TetR/AcrR family transcriptional regulator n=1 Tax=Dyella sp. M7H15-1 TaxID=2501295 RepID=UPI001004D76F|nr:TetR/AcrR family transcriptional regulator [Dyella sp. M7H15-1]QAU23007.1 TetR/AcrR family transcriptional regulator [Dyella sp. M7H15-1]